MSEGSVTIFLFDGHESIAGTVTAVYGPGVVYADGSKSIQTVVCAAKNQTELKMT
jgi:hypothetical protein